MGAREAYLNGNSFARRRPRDAGALVSVKSPQTGRQNTNWTASDGTIGMEVSMAIRTTRSAGMLLLGIWLIITGIGSFAALPIPGILMGALALIAGVLILVGV